MKIVNGVIKKNLKIDFLKYTMLLKLNLLDN
jgi:hypothetical protein